MGVRVWHGAGDPSENIAGWYCSTSMTTLAIPIFHSHWAEEQAIACLNDCLKEKGDPRTMHQKEIEDFIEDWKAVHLCRKCHGDGCLQMLGDAGNPECHEGMVGR